MSRQNRSYDKEFKLNAVQLCKNSGKPAGKIASDLGIPKQTLYQWIKDYEADGKEGFRGKGNIRPSNEELYFLKKELTDVKMERDILKKAIAIFSKKNA
jgi:transposase